MAMSLPVCRYRCQWVTRGSCSRAGSSGNIQGVSGLRFMTMTILLADLLLAGSAPAQSVPISPDHPWHGSAEFNMRVYTKSVADSRVSLYQLKTYSLSELIDLAEAHNPATRAAWER